MSGTEVEPPATFPAGGGAPGAAAAGVLRLAWLKRRDCAAAILITSISDKELQTVHAVDGDPVLIWGRLRGKIDRRSEAEAETAQMSLLDFAHREGKIANATIDRFESVVSTCRDQGVVVDENLQKRMMLARPADRYSFLKQSYLLAPIASRPDLVGLKAQIRDIDAEYQMSAKSISLARRTELRLKPLGARALVQVVQNGQIAGLLVFLAVVDAAAVDVVAEMVVQAARTSLATAVDRWGT